MPNQFVNIPVPSANAAGAAVDVSAMGATKTLICGGSFEANVNIEYATDDLGTDFAPLATFQNPGNQTVSVAARWLRAVTSAYKGGAANVDVGASGAGSFFAQIPTPPAGGVGASVAVNLLPLFKTVVVSGPVDGTVNIEVSEDGVSWAQVMTFLNGGGKSLSFYAAFARARSDGPTPTIWIGGADEGTSVVAGGTVPLAALVYRPGATGADAPGGNVYTDWSLLMTALDATRHLGERVLEFDDMFQSPAPVPAGVWNWTDVKLVNVARRGRVTVELLDGASIVVDPSPNPFNPRALAFEGFGLFFLSNRQGPVAPFVNINFLVGGNNVRFYNNDPLAKPMFVGGGFNLYIFSGENANGGFGNFGDTAAPLIDMAGGMCVVLGGAGSVPNNLFTDSVGGGQVFVTLLEAFRSDFQNAWFNPALTGVGGFVAADEIRGQTRWRVNPDYFGVPVVPALSPYAASYSEFVPVDTSLGPVTVNLPNAALAIGDQVTVKDVGLVVAGVGDTFAFALGVVTLTDLAGLFTAAMVGQTVVIAGSTSPAANDGAYIVASFVSPISITYANAAGVTEAFPGTWSVGGAAANNITIGSTYGNAVEGGPIATNGGSKTWVSIGSGSWFLTAQV